MCSFMEKDPPLRAKTLEDLMGAAPFHFTEEEQIILCSLNTV